MAHQQILHCTWSSWTGNGRAESISQEFDNIYICGFVLALCTTLGLLQVVGLKQFHAMRDKYIIKKRYPRIVVKEAAICIVLFLIICPLRIVNDYWLNHHSGEDHPFQIYAIGIGLLLGLVITPAMSYFVLNYEAMRLWLMSYELGLMQSLQREEWESKISSNDWKNDFYLRNRSKWGNVHWISKRVLFLSIFMSLLTSSAAFLENCTSLTAEFYSPSRSIQAICMLLPMLFIVVLYLISRKSFETADNMMIRDEFQSTCILMILFLIGYAVVIILNVFVDHATAAFLAATIFWYFWMSFPSFIATIWIPNRVKRNEQSGRTMSARNLALQRGLFKGHVAGRYSIRTDLTMVFGSALKMKALMNCMVRDFASECSLCFVEMAQFKEYAIMLIQRRNPHFDAETMIEAESRFKFYEHCPKSSIVFNGDSNLNEVVLEMVSFRERTEKIHNKKRVHFAVESGSNKVWLRVLIQLP